MVLQSRTVVQKRIFIAFLALFLTLPSVAGLVWTSTAQAEDELNCVLCHKLRGLSRIDENGRFRLFYINEKLFMKGPHKRIMCMDCHRDIKKVPHDPAEKVSCTEACHLTEPSGKEKFSHKPVEEVLAKSVHGKYDENGKLKEYSEDYPGCKDCHQTGDFAEDFYSHVTSRLQKTRESKEIVEICAKCHGDKKFQERHNLDDVVTSYKETFHGKAVRFGSNEAADCVDCHAVYGESAHLIESKESPSSATHKDNVAATCRNEECHHEAGENIAGYQVHTDYENAEKYPLQHYMHGFFKALMAAVMYFFIILIFLELLRRLFPNFAFTKPKLPNTTPVLKKTRSERGV